MSLNNYKFEDYFKISTMPMRISRCHPFIIRNLFWKIWFCLVLGLSVFGITVLFNSAMVYDIPKGKYAEGCKNIIMGIVAVTITLKFVLTVYYQDSLIELINIVDQDYELAKEFPEVERKIVLSHALRGVKLCKLWCFAVVSTSALFPLKAIWLMFRSYWNGEFKLVHIFDLTYPPVIDTYKNDPIGFSMYFLLNLVFGLYATTIYLGFDTLVPIFMLHNCGQLDVLAGRVTKIFSETKSDKQINEDMRNIILKLQQIYEFVEVIKANFTFVYEYNLKTTTFLLPLNAFHIVEALRHGEFNVEFLTFFIADILHFYMPCYYSDLLMERSEEIGQALYSSGWEQCPNLSIRKTVLFMMTRTSRPLVISTIFYPICLDTFAEMCRQSYTIFNLINAAWG